MRVLSKYILRASLATALVGAIQILGLVYFIKLVLDPSPDEFQGLVNYAIPLVIVLLLIFGAAIIRPIGSIAGFLRASPEEHSFSDEDLVLMQQRCINLGYNIAFISFLFYLVFAPLAAIWFGSKVAGWGAPQYLMASTAGLIAGLLNMPIALLITNIVVRPVIERTFEFSASIPRAGRMGFKLGVQAKLTLAMFFLIMTSLLYTAIIGYSQTRLVLESGKAIEAKLIEQGGAIEEGVENDAGYVIHSMSYYESRMGNMRLFYGLVVAACAVLGLLISSLAASEISRPVRELVQRTQNIIDGNMDQELHLVGNDEMAYLGQVFNSMIHKVKDQVDSMSSVGDRIAQMINLLDQTSRSILGVASEQSSGATEQASAMHETSAISSQIVATAKQIAERASQMDNMAGSTIKACGEGRDRLTDAVKGFEDISRQMTDIFEFLQRLSERYQDMFKVVEIIEDISEQTELLAFNASLEAAGAGEAGRRFEVVASSTRSLAARTSEATSDIRELISTIQKSTAQATLMAGEGENITEGGRELIDQVTGALEEISDKATDTSTSVQEITLSTRQQTSASEQMAQSINEVNQVAGKVLEGAKEIEIVITQLAQLTEELRQMTSSILPEKPREDTQENPEPEDKPDIAPSF